MKEVIQIPDTLEIKEIKDGKIILVEKEKKNLTYENIAGKLFKNKEIFYLNRIGEIDHTNTMHSSWIKNYNNCTSEKQAEKLLAINMLMNVAKYLNSDWKPDWNDIDECKYYIQMWNNSEIYIGFTTTTRCGDVYFKSKKLAKQAVEILGKETIKLALCTDY